MCLQILNKLYAIHKSRYHSCKISITTEFSEMSTNHDHKQSLLSNMPKFTSFKAVLSSKRTFFCRESIYFITQRIWKNLLYFLANMWIVQKWKSILELLKTQTILELKMAQPNSITYIIHESWFQRSSIFSLNETKLKVQKYLVSQ